MTDLPAWNEILTTPTLDRAFRAVIVLTLTLVFTAIARRLFRSRVLQAHHALLVRRLLTYAIISVGVLWALRELGLNLGVLLGAAGIATVALGFAAQTVASNALSGFFLMGEQPFVVGDVVKIGDKTGEVISIDLLSIRLRTFDNLMVRIPSEQVMKSPVTNNTAFPIRRLDLKVGVAYKEDLTRVREVLLDIADSEPACMEEPEPLLIFEGFGSSSIDMQFSVWAQRERFLEVRNLMYMKIKARFDSEGIEIPFPHRTLYAGSATGPLPVRLTGANEASTEQE